MIHEQQADISVGVGSVNTPPTHVNESRPLSAARKVEFSVATTFALTEVSTSLTKIASAGA